MNYDRRKLLKILAVAGGVGLYAKFFGSSTVDFLARQTGSGVRVSESNQFRIEEQGGALNIYSKEGEQLFVIDNER